MLSERFKPATAEGRGEPSKCPRCGQDKEECDKDLLPGALASPARPEETPQGGGTPMTPARSEEVAAEFVRKHYGIGMTAGHWAEKIAALLREAAEGRDRLWCAALVAGLRGDPELIERVTFEFNRTRPDKPAALKEPPDA